MILVSDLYQLLLDGIRADKRGLSVEVEEYNRLIRLVNQDVYDTYIKDFENNTENSDTLGWFKVLNYSIDLTLSSGVMTGTMPENYYYIIGKPRILDGTALRGVDRVTSLEDAVREEDYLTKATVTYPTCRVASVNSLNQLQIKVRPSTVTKIWIDYLKTPTVPFLDYYINNTTLVKTFLPMTSTAQSLPLGCTYRSGTAGGTAVTVTSLTKDLDFDDGDIPLLLSKLVQRVGAILPDEGLVTTGMADELKTQD